MSMRRPFVLCLLPLLLGELFDPHPNVHGEVGAVLYGIGLPDDVLRQLCYGKALRIISNMPTAGFLVG